MNLEDSTHILAYNYDSFRGEKFEKWLRFDDSPALGVRLPDFTLYTLEGDAVQLSQYWKKAAYLVVEFGSAT